MSHAIVAAILGSGLMVARVTESEPSSPSDVTPAPSDADWTITVTEPLPNCPSVQAGWERIATQTNWGEWTSEGKMRGKDVTTTVVPPAVEPLKTGDEYLRRADGS